MKIERKNNNKWVEFGNLKRKDVFEDKYNHIWMKIDLSLVLDNINYEGDGVGSYMKCVSLVGSYMNCVSLEDGYRKCIDDSFLVKPYPNAKVVLEDE